MHKNLNKNNMNYENVYSNTENALTFKLNIK